LKTKVKVSILKREIDDEDITTKEMFKAIGEFIFYSIRNLISEIRRAIIYPFGRLEYFYLVKKKSPYKTYEYCDQCNHFPYCKDTNTELKICYFFQKLMS
jgi:hypothetical protein